MRSPPDDTVAALPRGRARAHRRFAVDVGDRGGKNLQADAAPPRHRAIENVYGAALAKSGIAANVLAVSDPARGTLVRIELADIAQKALADEALARYSVSYAIV